MNQDALLVASEYSRDAPSEGSQRLAEENDRLRREIEALRRG
jgi:hypothetical protein